MSKVKSEICCQCSCHSSVSNSQSDDQCETIPTKNLVNDNPAEIEEILNGMNLNPKLLKGIKEFGFERIVASMDPSILQPENGDHVFSIPSSTIPKFDNFEKLISWILRQFVPVIPVLQQIDCSVRKCQVLIMSSSSYLLRETYTAITRVGKYMAIDVEPSKLYACINKKYLRKYKSNTVIPQIMIGSFDNILSLITTEYIELQYIKTLVVIELDSSTKQMRLDHEVFKYLPRNVKLFTSTDYLMRSIKKKFQTPAQEIIRIKPPPPKIKKNKKKAKKNEVKVDENFEQAASCSYTSQNPQNDERNKKRKISKINKGVVTGTSNAQNVELQDCKKIKLEKDINQIDTTDAHSVESRVCKKTKLEPEEEIMRIDTSGQSVESGDCIKIEEDCIQID